MAGAPNKLGQDPTLSLSTTPGALRKVQKTQQHGQDLDRLTGEEKDLGAQAIESFVLALGGRDALTEALTVATGAHDVDEITKLLLDPRYDKLPLRRLCALANLTVVDLFAAYKKAIVVKAHIEATRIIASKLLPVVEDVMQRAAPFQVACETCLGTGQIQEPAPIAKEGQPQLPPPPPSVCDVCLGQGQVLRLPDLERQKLALELGQLVQRNSGVSILNQQLTLSQTNVQGNGGGGSRAGALEALQLAVGGILSRPPQIAEVESAPVEAEIVSEAPTDS